jgi:hypothetical protein
MVMKRQIAVILLTPLILAAASTGARGEDLFYRTEQIAQQKARQLRVDRTRQDEEQQRVPGQRGDELTARVDAPERQLRRAR